MNGIKQIYLDNAASTRPFPEVIELMKEILDTEYGNSSSVHMPGINARRIIRKATETLADILNCRPDEIIFTSGGAESNNLAIKGYAYANPKKGKQIVTSAFEHPTVLDTVKYLNKFGYENYICGLDINGNLNKSEVMDNIDENTLLVSIMTVNSETGVYTDLGELSTGVKAINPNIVVHSDAVQAFCKLPVDLSLWQNVDLMSLSSHKIKGPKGVGALFIRKGTGIDPIFSGGGHHSGLRAGTENTAGIAGFAFAAEIFSRESKKYHKHVTELNSYLRKQMALNIDGILINSPEKASPYILNIAIKDILSETMLNHLSGNKIFLSAGSACSSKNKRNSHVLEAMNIPKDYIEGALRFSFSPMNEKKELDTLMKEIIAILPILRKVRKK